MLERQILDMVKKVILEYVKEIPAQVYLFGSRAKNKERNSSDVDVGILIQNIDSADFFPDLRSRLDESIIPYRVDLVDLSKVDPAFLKKVKEEGILWKD